MYEAFEDKGETFIRSDSLEEFAEKLASGYNPSKLLGNRNLESNSEIGLTNDEAVFNEELLEFADTLSKGYQHDQPIFNRPSFRSTIFNGIDDQPRVKKDITKFFGINEKQAKKSFFSKSFKSTCFNNYDIKSKSIIQTMSKAISKFRVQLKEKVEECHEIMLSVRERLDMYDQHHHENFKVDVNPQRPHIYIPHFQLVKKCLDNKQLNFSEALESNGVTVIDLLRAENATWPKIFGSQKQYTNPKQKTEHNAEEKIIPGIDIDAILESIMGDNEFKKKILKAELYNQEAFPELFGLHQKLSDPLFNDSNCSTSSSYQSSLISSNSCSFHENNINFNIPHFENMPSSSAPVNNPLYRKDFEICDVDVSILISLILFRRLKYCSINFGGKGSAN